MSFCTVSLFRPWSETSSFCFSIISVQSTLTLVAICSLPQTCSSASSSLTTAFACLGIVSRTVATEDVSLPVLFVVEIVSLNAFVAQRKW